MRTAREPLDKLEKLWWPLSTMATGFVAFGVLKASISQLQADVADIQATRPYVQQQKIDREISDEADFRKDVKNSLGTLQASVSSINSDVARIKGQLDKGGQQ
ncbi:MAG: hypothetical protein M3O30_17440 [Planctomycetota bacterium]|nr:hypothetical protein [Planctomycetota bacterium]